MEPIIVFSLFFIIVFVAWCVGTYNKLVKHKNRIEEAWSGIDVALKRRFNLIPNLVRAIQAYGDHEAAIFQNQAQLKEPSRGVTSRAEEEHHISKSLHGLLALAEAYPDLKASANFLELQNSLNDIEEDIMKARNLYNRSVVRLNILVESFPALYIAKKFGFQKKNYFTLELVTQREMPDIQFSSPDQNKNK